MNRIHVPKRPNWQQRCEEAGFTFHSVGGIYWNEGVCYEFSASEVDFIEDATEELYGMCLKAAGHVIDSKQLSRIGFTDSSFQKMIEQSWREGQPGIYGRFDLAYNGNELKLLEFNADTPTALLEASIAQWMWLEDFMSMTKVSGLDQFNSIHERLLNAFGSLKRIDGDRRLYFSCIRDSDEDMMTTEYLRDVASQVGFDTVFINIEDIGISDIQHGFYDLYGNEIKWLFKLYPWEWLSQEEFGKKLYQCDTLFCEPPWKAMLSSKAILGILWEMFPGHPLLLETHFSSDEFSGNGLVKKPFFSREGANITLIQPDSVELSTTGTYGSEGYVYQAFFPLPCMEEKNYPVIGSWIIDNKPAGMGIREDDTEITKNTSRFVPHYFI